MFGIGFPEMILILALALIVVGPDKLPDLARSIAKTVMDLKKTAEGLKDNLKLEDNPLKEIKPDLEDAARNFKETLLDAETKTWKSPEQNQAQDSAEENQTTENSEQSDTAEEKGDSLTTPVEQHTDIDKPKHPPTSTTPPSSLDG